MKKLSMFILTLATAILIVSCNSKKDETIKNEITQKATEVKTDVKDAAEDIKEKAVDTKDIAVEKAIELKEKTKSLIQDNKKN